MRQEQLADEPFQAIYNVKFANYIGHFQASERSILANFVCLPKRGSFYGSFYGYGYF